MNFDWMNHNAITVLFYILRNRLSRYPIRVRVEHLLLGIKFQTTMDAILPREVKKKSLDRTEAQFRKTDAFQQQPLSIPEIAANESLPKRSINERTEIAFHREQLNYHFKKLHSMNDEYDMTKVRNHIPP